MEVPSPYFSIAQIPPMKKKKTNWAKNTSFKLHGAKIYLTQNFNTEDIDFGKERKKYGKSIQPLFNFTLFERKSQCSYSFFL
jgi:hypothetical protein